VPIPALSMCSKTEQAYSITSSVSVSSLSGTVFAVLRFIARYNSESQSSSAGAQFNPSSLEMIAATGGRTL
jgi:hypothetical protein